MIRIAPDTVPSTAHSHAARQLATVLLLIVLIVASFWSLDLNAADILAVGSLQRMGRFALELLHPELTGGFLAKVGQSAIETLAMSALGTLIAAALAFCLTFATPYLPVRPILRALRAIPELVWASMLLIAVGLGPFAGTLALALHTTGVLGRLFLDALENQTAGPSFALESAGATRAQVFLYARLPQALPQVLSYTLYRWENNIRAAAVLGVVGAGGLGQMLTFHLGLFQMAKASTVIAATLLLVALVDLVSDMLRRRLS